MIRFDGRWTEKSERRTADYSINLVSFSFRSISNRPVHDELNARTNCFNANTRTRHSVIYPLPKREGGREREKKCSKSKWRMLFIEDEGDECVPTSQRSCSTVWNDDDAQWDETDFQLRKSSISTVSPSVSSCFFGEIIIEDEQIL